MGVNANDASAAAPSTTKKYHLVEAEEVDATPRTKAAPGSATKKKGKTSWSQFPLDGAADDSAESERSDESSQRNGANGFRGGRGGRGGRSFNGGRGGRGPRRNYDSNGAYINGVYVPNTDPKMTAQWAKEQMYVVCSLPA